jgi:hypothetical protein
MDQSPEPLTVYYCPNPHDQEWRTLWKGDRCPVCGSELKPRGYVIEIDALHDLALEIEMSRHLSRRMREFGRELGGKIYVV